MKMKSSTVGPVIAVCVAGVTAAGCLATSRPVKVTEVRTPSAPASKIDLYYGGSVRAIEARDYAQALDYLQAARAIAPDDVRVINAFGVVYDKLGRFDLSRRYYAQAKALDPTSRVVENNLAYSERLQGLSKEPLAFASAADAEARLKTHDNLMPGSPVVVVPIAGPEQVVMVDTIPAVETAPELFGLARRTRMAAASAATVKPAAAQVARVEVKSQAAAAPAPIQLAAATPKPAKLLSATPKPVQFAAAPVERVEVKSQAAAAPAPIQLAAATLKPAKLTSAAPKPVLIAQAEPKPVAAKTLIAAPAKAPVIVQAKAPVAAPAKAPVVVPAKAPAQIQAKAQTKLAGAPILLVDASGSPDAARRVSQRLTRLGWSVQAAPASHVRPMEASRIDYPARTPQIAQALARTLPGAVKVHLCAGACPAIRLVVGKDALAWNRPRKDILALAQPKKTVGRS
jgi:hypothetical protein